MSECREAKSEALAAAEGLINQYGELIEKFFLISAEWDYFQSMRLMYHDHGLSSFRTYVEFLERKKKEAEEQAKIRRIVEDFLKEKKLIPESGKDEEPGIMTGQI